MHKTSGRYHKHMTKAKTKKSVSKKEHEAYSRLGHAGGLAIVKKLGKKGMAELGRKGAKALWAKCRAAKKAKAKGK